MLQILQDVENSQAQLQNVLKTTATTTNTDADRREDTVQTAAVADSTAAGNTPAVANLLNMEHIVKALEVDKQADHRSSGQTDRDEKA